TLPCATGERTILAHSSPRAWNPSAKAPRPRSSLGSSLRGTAVPTVISWPPSRDVEPEARRLAPRMVVPVARNAAPREARGGFRAIGGPGVSPGRHCVSPGQHCSPPAGRDAVAVAFGPAAAAGHYRWLADGASFPASGHPEPRGVAGPGGGQHRRDD